MLLSDSRIKYIQNSVSEYEGGNRRTISPQLCEKNTFYNVHFSTPLSIDISPNFLKFLPISQTSTKNKVHVHAVKSCPGGMD